MTHIPSVAHVMTPFPFSVEPDAPLRVARAMMAEHRVHHLPVVEAHRLVGVLSDRDIKRALDPALGNPPADELFVRDVYVPQPYAVDDSTPLDEVLEYMAANRVGSVLVTKHNRLAGIFTVTDACREYCLHLRRLFPPTTGDGVA